MKARSTTVPGASSSASSNSRPSPANNAMSPPMPDLDELVGDRDAVPTTPRTFCGSLNRIRPASGSGLTAMILAPLAFAFSSDRQHARVVGAGVLAGDQDAVGVREVVDGHRALADADGLGQGRARGFVAHVGAVGQVVGAEAAHQQLIEERGLVAGAARGVEHASSGLSSALRWSAINRYASSQSIGW